MTMKSKVSFPLFNLTFKARPIVLLAVLWHQGNSLSANDHDPTCSEKKLPQITIKTDQADGKFKKLTRDYLPVSVSVRTFPSMGDDHCSFPDNQVATAGEAAIRGQSSSYFPKTQIKLKTPEALPFLGLDKDDDWVLNGPYADYTGIRNGLSYKLAGQLMASLGKEGFVPKYKFVTVNLNDSPMGVYLLTEKIKKDKVDLKKFDFEKEKKEGFKDFQFLVELDGGNQVGEKKTRYKTKHGSTFTPEYPELKHMPNKEKDGEAYKQVIASIKEKFDRFEDELVTSDFGKMKSGDDQGNPVGDENLEEEGYRKHINMDSFINYDIMKNLLSKDLDGYRRSVRTFIGKDGKFHMGPLWDFDLAYGNVNMPFLYGKINKPKGWQVRFKKLKGRHLDGNKELFWLFKFQNDPYYLKKLRSTYRQYRAPGGLLDLANLNKMIDDLAAEISCDWNETDIQKWKSVGGPHFKPLLASFFHSGRPYKKDHKGEIEKLKAWIKTRLEWVDGELDHLLEHAEKKIEKKKKK